MTENPRLEIAIIGAGNVGTLGKRLAAVGHDVVYGLREPSNPKYAHLDGQIARRDDVQGAAAAAEVVVLATPWRAARSALEAAGDLAGKPLLDATNPIGPGFQLTHGLTDSGGEQVARWAQNARVVKVFNTTGAENMGNPTYGAHASMMLACGDDDEAVDVALRLASDIGFDAHRFGPLANARYLEPFAMTWIQLAMKYGHGRDFAFARVTR